MKLFVSSLSSGETKPVIQPTIKDFRYGADYAISSNSDVWSGVNQERVEFMAWKYGIRSTVFEESTSTPVSRDQYTQGIFESSIYWLTDRYNNGTYAVDIPDYYSDTWTSAGVSAFPVAVLGEAKPTRYPNLGTQMMYISGGLVGIQLDVPYTDWDKGLTPSVGVDPDESPNANIIATGTNGDGMILGYLTTSIQGNIGYSYRNGQEGTRQLYEKYLQGGRNSSDSKVSLGEWFDSYEITSRADISYPSTSRVMDTTDIYTVEQNIDNVEANLEAKTIPNGGWYNNFTHWWSANMFNFESFYSRLKTVKDRNSEICWDAGMSEAVGYLWFKDMITGVAFNGSVITVNIDNKYNLDLTKIFTPISIEIDLTGTSLSGKNITANQGRVRSLGSDKFIVEVYATSLSTTISQTSNPDYINLDYPVLLTDNFMTDTLTVTTDVLTKVTLFSDEVGTVIERKYTDSDSHVFTGLSSGQTYYLGIMSRENKTIIETITT